MFPLYRSAVICGEGQQDKALQPAVRVDSHHMWRQKLSDG